MEKLVRAVNWNRLTDNVNLTFWEQNLKQMWVDTELVPAKDKDTWKLLTEDEKEVYKKVLVGLTALDTEQGGLGMPLILLHTKDLQQKSILAFMGAMEEIHAKSYSTIFTTLAKLESIDAAFEWGEQNKHLQYKGSVIKDKYIKLFTPIATNYDIYMAMVASVYLESFLFYSGFFYPLYLAGQGKMTASGEIINLILRDESIHGVFVGYLAQKQYNLLTDEEKERAEIEVYQLLEDLMSNEIVYTEEVYGSINLHSDVKKFLKYNANKALMNLGRASFYQEETINPIVLNGLNTDTKTHDFFSMKGNGYQKGKVEYLRDEDFIF